MRTANRSLLAFAPILGALLAGCGTRDPVWDTRPGPLVAFGLQGSAAIVDTTGERALMLPVEGDLTLSPVSVPIGRGFATAAPTLDGSRLLVLTHGDVPRKKSTDQAPGLAVIGGDTSPAAGALYPLASPISGLAVDPLGAYAVVYSSAADVSFIENPNELSIVDLGRAPSADNPVPLTLRSFGGQPQSFTFTPTLSLPAGPGRLLVVLTDRDVGIIDLSAPAKGDVTVQLSSSGQRVTPAAVAVTDGPPGTTDGAELAILLANDPNIVLVDLLPVLPDQRVAHTFRPTPNIVFAGGPPTDLAFLHTDGGLRLGALVPSQQNLTLIDPATGIATTVGLGGAFESFTVVTAAAGGGTGGSDVALAWSTQSPEIAFIDLGGAVGTPYRAVQVLQLEQPVARVLDVPSPNQRLKLLVALDGQSFFVLDLVNRTASPIAASTYGTVAGVARDGRHAWLFSPGEPDIAQLDLQNLHPLNLTLDQPVGGAFDVARRDGGRALVAIHENAGFGVTVLDGPNPSLESAVEYAAVLLGNLR